MIPQLTQPRLQAARFRPMSDKPLPRQLETRRRIAALADALGGKANLAAQTGISPSMLSRMMPDSKTPLETITDAALHRLAGKTGVGYEYLKTGQGPQRVSEADAYPMEEEGARLQAYLYRNGKDKSELAKLLGVNPSVTTGYVRSKTLDPSTREKLLALNLPGLAEAVFRRGGGPAADRPATTTGAASPQPTAGAWVDLPLLRVADRAGFDSERFWQQHTPAFTVRRESIDPKLRDRPTLVLEINDDQMGSTLGPGYLVVAYEEPVTIGGEPNYDLTGLVAVQFGAGEFAVKRIRQNLRSEPFLNLYSDDPNGWSRSIPREQIRAMFRIGRVVDGQPR